MQQLCKSICDEQRHVDEPIHTVRKAGLRLAVQLVTRLVDAFIPAEVVEFVNLEEIEVQVAKCEGLGIRSWL